MKSFNKLSVLSLVLLIGVLLCGFTEDSCDSTSPPVSNSGVTKANVQVAVGGDGLTAEQRNVRSRLIEDNKPGSIKHLYVISPYSGQVILYSTVKGKVTSGGKRLTPTAANSSLSQGGNWYGGFQVTDAKGNSFITNEVLQDDGTYGSSGEYLYWWDVRGSYHQHYLTGGQIITISDQPLPVKSVTINIEKAGD